EPGRRERPAALVRERLDDRGLEARGDIRADVVVQRSALPLGVDREPHGGLEPAEAEVEPLPPQRPREREATRIAGLGERRERWASGIRQRQEPRDLVERLPRRVVERLSDDPVPAETRDVDEQRMAAGDEQREERELGRIRLEPAR